MGQGQEDRLSVRQKGYRRCICLEELVSVVLTTLLEEDLKSYGLSPINDEDNVGPPLMVQSPSTVVPPGAIAEVVLSVSSAEVVQPTAVPSSNTVVPPLATIEVATIIS